MREPTINPVRRPPAPASMHKLHPNASKCTLLAKSNSHLHTPTRRRKTKPDSSVLRPLIPLTNPNHRDSAHVSPLANALSPHGTGFALYPLDLLVSLSILQSVEGFTGDQ